MAYCLTVGSVPQSLIDVQLQYFCHGGVAHWSDASRRALRLAEYCSQLYFKARAHYTTRVERVKLQRTVPQSHWNTESLFSSTSCLGRALDMATSILGVSKRFFILIRCIFPSVNFTNGIDVSMLLACVHSNFSMAFIYILKNNDATRKPFFTFTETF